MIKDRSEAMDAIGDIYRQMHRVKVPFSVVTFRMRRLMEEWNISRQELDSIRRRVIRELSYIIV